MEDYYEKQSANKGIRIDQSGLVEQLLQIRRIWLRIGSACSFEGAI
jgi:hypothetical protein